MNEGYPWSAIPMTFLVAIVLTLLPMPDWTIWLRPAWPLMVLTYWISIAPYRVNIGTAFFLGLVLDVLSGTLLGEHALALCPVAYFVVRLQSQFRMYPVLHQGLWVFFYVLLYQFILYCIQGFLGQLPNNWLYWSSSGTSMLLWPWVSTIIRDSCRRFRPAI